MEGRAHGKSIKVTSKVRQKEKLGKLEEEKKNETRNQAGIMTELN